jgi:hypothetical protein
MLEYHTRIADRYAFAAIGAFLLDYNISAVLSTVDGILRTNLLAFTALDTDFGLVNSRLRKSSLDPQGRFPGIDFAKMFNGTDLQA